MWPAARSRSSGTNVFLAVIEARRPDIARGLGLRVRPALVLDAVLRWRHWSTSLVRDRRVPTRAAGGLPPAAAVPRPESRPAPSLVLGETHFTDRARPRARPAVADDPAARPLHGRHGPGRGRHRQDVRLHVSVRGPAPALARRRRRPQGGRTGDGGEGRLLPAGAGPFSTARAGPTTTSRSGSTPASATTRCTTTSTRMRWPTPSPRC